MLWLRSSDVPPTSTYTHACLHTHRHLYTHPGALIPPLSCLTPSFGTRGPAEGSACQATMATTRSLSKVQCTSIRARTPRTAFLHRSSSLSPRWGLRYSQDLLGWDFGNHGALSQGPPLQMYNTHSRGAKNLSQAPASANGSSLLSG